MFEDFGLHGLDVERFLDAKEANRLGIESADGMFSEEEAEDGLAGFTGRGKVVRTNEFVRGMADMGRQDD
jgi:hypothetical protein